MLWLGLLLPASHDQIEYEDRAGFLQLFSIRNYQP